jgi:hypothetical protein
MKVEELTGAQLNYWVAKAEGVSVNNWAKDGAFYQPSSLWITGGPIIEREKFYLEWDADGYWCASTPVTKILRGPTPLIAAMRAHVIGYFGETVPDEVPA